MDPSNHKLREALSEAIGHDLADQPSLVKRLRVEFPHSVELFCQAICSDPRTWQFNCHAFATGLSGTEEES
jgi:hypothetical protein